MDIQKLESLRDELQTVGYLLDRFFAGDVTPNELMRHKKRIQDIQYESEALLDEINALILEEFEHGR